MPEKAPKLVIRTYTPRREVLAGVGAALLAAIALYVAYEYGRAWAGFDSLHALRQRVELEARIDELESDERQMRAQIAELDTIRASQAQERAEVSRTIGELQAQVARQSQELAFYKGIVVQKANAADVAIQQLRITRGPEPHTYVVRLNLVQPARPDSQVSGMLLLNLEGRRGGKVASLDLAALTSGKQREVPYSFRYFEKIDVSIAVPAGFEPERLNAEVRSSRRGVEPLRLTHLWAVEAT
jgi:hypothetical protein